MSYDTDLMVLGAHPDDAEIGCGGLILKTAAAGRKVVVVDMTRGEAASRGTEETREQECQAASRLLGLHARINLGLRDAGMRDDEESLGETVNMLRKWRPRVLAAHHQHDRHPDHTCTASLAWRAHFHAGLRNYRPDLGAPFRPQLFLRYPGNDHIEPTLCLDISEFEDKKRRVVECYQTQVKVKDSSLNVSGVDHLDRLLARDRYFGTQIGCRAAEPYVTNGPVRVPDLFNLLE